MTTNMDNVRADNECPQFSGKAYTRIQDSPAYQAGYAAAEAKYKGLVEALRKAAQFDHLKECQECAFGRSEIWQEVMRIIASLSQAQEG